jgi:Glycosyl hydrolase family 79 C-terminal beta domain
LTSYLNVSSLFFRQQYNLWYPLDTDRNGPAQTSPSFVAYLFVAETVGSSGQSRLSYISIPPQPQLAVYAVWEEDRLDRFAILNLANRNASMSASDAVALEANIDLSPYLQGGEAKVKRMTAPGMDSTDTQTATWAGQSYADGTAAGDESVEQTQNGVVRVAGSEGVLVFLNSSN